MSWHLIELPALPMLVMTYTNMYAKHYIVYIMSAVWLFLFLLLYISTTILPLHPDVSTDRIFFYQMVI